MIFFYYVLYFLVAAGLGLIPANIAKDKGYSFGLWWFYGFMLFIIAIIHVSLIKDKNAQQIPINVVHSNYAQPNNANSIADELKKYKELMDQGIITEEEFQTKKDQLLKLM